MKSFILALSLCLGFGSLMLSTLNYRDLRNEAEIRKEETLSSVSSSITLYTNLADQISLLAMAIESNSKEVQKLKEDLEDILVTKNNSDLDAVNLLIKEIEKEEEKMRKHKDRVNNESAKLRLENGKLGYDSLIKLEL